MGRTGEFHTFHPYGKWPDKHLEIQFAGPEPDADYLRNGRRLFANARPRWERNLLPEWQIVRVSDRISRTFKGIDEHCIRGRDSTHHFAGRKARDVRHNAHIREGRTLDV